MKKMTAFRLSEQTILYLTRIEHDCGYYRSKTEIIEEAVKMLYKIKDEAREIRESTKKTWIPEGQIKIDI